LTNLGQLLTYANVKTSAEQRAAATGICQTNVIDERKVAAVESALATLDECRDAAEMYAALGDPTRLRLLHALAHEELCVCDLAHLVNRSMPTTSRQLQLLRRVGLVKFRAQGKLVYYTLANKRVERLVRDAVSGKRANSEGGSSNG